MNKKTIWIILISIILISLIAFSVHAADDKSFTDKIGKGFGYVTAIVGTFFSMISSDPITWIKLLMWIAVFIAAFFGAQKIGMERKLAGVIAAILAFMVIIVIPGEVLVSVATTYGAIFISLLVCIPFFFICWASIKIGKKSRWAYFGLALGWIIFLMIMSALESSLEEAMTKTSGKAWQIAGAAESVIIIIWIISILVILFLIIWGIAMRGGTILEPSGKTGKLGRFVRRKLGREVMLEAKSLGFLEDAKNNIQASAWSNALDDLKQVEKLDAMEKNAGMVLGRVEEKMEELVDKKHPEARGLKTELNKLKHANYGLIKYFLFLRKMIKLCEKSIGRKDQPDALKKIEACIKREEMLLVMTKRLIALERDIDKRLSLF